MKTGICQPGALPVCHANLDAGLSEDYPAPGPSVRSSFLVLFEFPVESFATDVQ